MGLALRHVRAALLLAAAFAPGIALAQREIVQPLPPAGTDELNVALGRLARNPTDVAALVDAGEAALKVGDIAAAIGFFGRANELSPDNSRVKLGLGMTYARSRRPVEALRLFAEAERAGVDKARMAADRALAFDLVGDARSAQEYYRLALVNGAGDEVRRRLALSQAIAGDRAGFEATLLPLLEKKDLAAFRTRAFGLAILGQAKEAIGIADAMLPPPMAQRIRPYLEYMPRLTQAQQAAAGSLGIFPRAANIGTDEPDIASYASARQADARAATAAAQAQATRAEPAREEPRSQQRRRRPDRTGARPGRTAEPPPDLSPATVRARQDAATRQVATARETRSAPPPPPPPPATVFAPPPPPPAPAPAPSAGSTRMGELPPAVPARAMSISSPPPPPPPPAAAPRPVPPPAPVATAAGTPGRSELPPVAAQAAPAPAPTRVAVLSPTPTPTPAPAPVTIIAVPTPGPSPATAPAPASSPPVVVARAPGVMPAPVAALPAPLPVPPPPPPGPVVVAVAPAQPAPVLTSPQAELPAEPSLEEAFASFTLAPGTAAAAPASGAVDITAIAIPRERPKPPPPPPPPQPPPPPKYPARSWVQVATGKDRGALAFDWRRIEKKAEGRLKGKGPFVAKWVQANRLLAGPFKDDKAAAEFMKELKKLEIDSFTFRSAEGELVEPLK